MKRARRVAKRTDIFFFSFSVWWFPIHAEGSCAVARTVPTPRRPNTCTRARRQARGPPGELGVGRIPRRWHPRSSAPPPTSRSCWIGCQPWLCRRLFSISIWRSYFRTEPPTGRRCWSPHRAAVVALVGGGEDVARRRSMRDGRRASFYKERSGGGGGGSGVCVVLCVCCVKKVILEKRHSFNAFIVSFRFSFLSPYAIFFGLFSVASFSLPSLETHTI